MDPFDALTRILNDDHCASLPDELEGGLKGLIDDEFQKLLNQLQSEYEYLTSDECVVEMLNANEYLFTEAGERIPRGLMSKFCNVLKARNSGRELAPFKAPRSKRSRTRYAS